MPKNATQHSTTEKMWLLSDKLGRDLVIGKGMDEILDIQLAREGLVTRTNFSRLGYERIIRGVYGRVARDEWLNEWERQRQEFFSRLHATVVAYQHKKAVLYGSTALQALGVALPRRLEDWESCHLLVPRGVTRPVRNGVTIHQARCDPQVWRCVGELPVLNPVEHWIQVRGATDSEFIQIGEGLVRRQSPLLTIDEMGEEISRLANIHGIKQARRVMKWIRPNTDSITESITRQILMWSGLPEPLVNLEVYCRAADRTYHLDMGYDKQKLGIEYDGAVHVGNRDQMEIDAIRRRHLQDEGWQIITVTATQLRAPESFTNSVKLALQTRR